MFRKRTTQLYNSHFIQFHGRTFHRKYENGREHQCTGTRRGYYGKKDINHYQYSTYAENVTVINGYKRSS